MTIRSLVPEVHRSRAPPGHLGSTLLPTTQSIIRAIARRPAETKLRVTAEVGSVGLHHCE
jgi:hypothetical protein